MHTGIPEEERSSLLAEGRSILASSADCRYLHRVEIVTLVMAGLSPTSLSHFSNETRTTIERWVKIACEQGIDALHEFKKTGRPSRLSSDELAEIGRLFQQPPAGSQKLFHDGQSLQAFIRQQYHVKLSIRQCQRIIRKIIPEGSM